MFNLFRLLISLFIALNANFAFSNSTKIKQWGSNIVNQGQSIGITWVTGAFVICGFLYLLGLRIGQEMLSRIVIGGSLIFGASAIAAIIKNVIN